MTGAIATILFVVGIVVAIMIHEWGHFASARRFGMRADRFFLGFGPTLWSTRRGETEYGVKALPLGGFVRIKGMSPTDERLQPISDVLLDPEALAADQRNAAAAGDGSADVPTLTERSYERLDVAMRERGVPQELRDRLLGTLRHEVADDATVTEIRTILDRAIDANVPERGRVGDLHHRLRFGDRGRFFADRPAWQRAIVLVAGSVMHFVQAAVLIFLVFWLSGPVQVLPVVDAIAEGSPAAAVLQPGDRVLAVDGIEADEFEGIRELIRARPGEPTALTIERDGQVLTVEATPAEATEDGQTIGQLGFSPLVDNVPLPVGEAAARTFVGEGSVTDLTVRTFSLMGAVFGPEGIGSIFSQVAGDEERGQDGAISMVGAGRFAAEGARSFGLFLILGSLLASINIFIGIFNLLPLPPLDGGHLAVLGVERGVNAVRRIAGKPADFSVDPRAIAAIAVPVIAIIGTISLALLWLDIVNPVRLGN